MRYVLFILLIFSLPAVSSDNPFDDSIEMSLEKILVGEISDGLRIARIGYNATNPMEILPSERLLQKCLMLTKNESDKKKSAAICAVSMLLQLRSNNLDEVKELFKQAIKSDPDLPELYDHVAVIYFMREQYSLALPLLDKAIQLNPKYADAIRNRAMARQYLKMFDDALADYQRYQKLIQP